MSDTLAFWKHHLSGLSSIQLPTDYPRSAGRKFVESEEVLEPTNEICRKILRLSLDSDTTPFTIVLSIFLVALHKFSLEEDVVIGSSSDEGDAVVLRLGIRGNMTFQDVIGAVQAEQLVAEQHRINFGILTDALKVPDSDTPLCQVRFFNMVDVRPETLDAVGSCDWSVFIEQKADAKRILPLKIRVSYNSLLFARERMAEFLNQIQKITEEVIQNNRVLVDDISILTEVAKSRIPNPIEPLDDTWMGSIQSVLARKAQEHPDRVMIVEEGGGSYTYGMVDALANRVANFLISTARVKVEDVVTIYAHRNAALVVAVMGILKAGATVSIIDPQYPAQRQIIYLQVARPKALVVLVEAGTLVAEVKDYLAETPEISTILSGLCMDPSKMPQLQPQSDVDPKIEIGPDNVSTLSFTSGSTGVPKGCRGRACSLTHFYPWMGQEFGLCSADRFSMLSGIAHDPIQRDIFTPIFFSATLYVPRQVDIVEPGRLAEWCARTGISITVLTPAMGQLLTADATAKIPSLRHAFFVGDVLAKRDVIRLQALAPNVKIVNMMGSTETQRAVSYLVIHNDETMRDQKEILPAGRGMKDVQLLVLNNRLRLCGIGEVGEIYFRSHFMAAGYLGLPEATKEKFFTNHFTKIDKDRLYKTGDMGRYLPSGIVECMGRSDDQVKIRGFRVELREIDTFLVQHPSVREAVTLLRRDVNEEHRLVAYFVPMNNGEYDIDVLRKHLGEKLPKYAIPSDFVPLARMPLNPNGKIDKPRLPFPDTVQSHLKAAKAETAKTIVQQAIHNVWSELLPGRQIDLSDSFFDIGGHSVLATRAIFRLRQALQLQDLALDMLYAFPTVERLAFAIESMRGDAVALVANDEKTKAQAREAASEPQRLVLRDQVRLDDSIKATAPPFAGTPRAILLTGATGFLGAYILHDLLVAFRDATVFCLARAASGADADAKSRIVENLHNRSLFLDAATADAALARVVGVAGDLGLPALGLSTERWNELSQCIDVVVHNGALVHWVLPYDQLKAVNVESTVEVLRLACSGGKTKAVHFVSSTSVLDTQSYVNRDHPVEESDSLDDGADGLSVGYGQSKWVSERILMLARSRGIPVTITRPGYILGHSVSGVCESDDFLWRLMKGCIELKLCPKMRNPLNCCPVDYVSALIVNLVASPGAIGKAFHTVNGAKFRFDDFFDIARSHGWHLEACDYLQWRDRLHEHTMHANDSALFPLLHFVLQDLPTKSRAPRLDNANALWLHQEERNLPLILRCNSMQSLMPKYLSFMVAVGFLPPPTPSKDDAVLPPSDPSIAKTLKGRRDK